MSSTFYQNIPYIISSNVSKEQLFLSNQKKLDEQEKAKKWLEQQLYAWMNNRHYQNYFTKFLGPYPIQKKRSATSSRPLFLIQDTNSMKL